MKIEEMNNHLFQLIENKEQQCWDLVFKQATYDTSAELLNIMSWLLELGRANPNAMIRIGAFVGKKPSSIIGANENKIIQ